MLACVSQLAKLTDSLCHLSVPVSYTHLSSESDEWSAEIIGSTRAPQHGHSYHVRENIKTPLNNQNVTCETDLWEEKLEEILSFQTKSSREEVSM